MNDTEKVDRLEMVIGAMVYERESLRLKLDKAREALKYFGDPDHWYFRPGDGWKWAMEHPLDYAIRALAELEEK